jgi:predicted enzyme related to lactoylglutathione lyase
MTDPLRLVCLILYVNDLVRSRLFYETVLGLVVVEEAEGSVKYDAGHVLLCLHRARDYGITLAQSHDNSADIVFLVDNIQRTRLALEARGIKFTPSVQYEIGSIADFYDPDGHWLTVYQPSETAMTWPSGRKISEVVGARDRRLRVSAVLAPDSPGSGERNGEAAPLAGKELLYLFLFVRDAGATAQFYHECLGLAYLEGGPCSQGLTSNDEGVIKYDAGGVMVATHHTEGTVYTDGSTPVEASLSEHTCPPRMLDVAHTKGVAPVFYVADIEQAVAEFSHHGVRFPDGLARSPSGTMARFEDPSGHQFFLYQASAEALRSPGGDKLREILAARWTTADKACGAPKTEVRVAR